MAFAGTLPGRELRVLFLGRTGSGKSSLANLIMGREAFYVASGMKSGTTACNWNETRRKDYRLQVTDTPGLCDTYLSEERVITEIAKSIAASAPGPHVVVIVLRCDKRFTQEEFHAYVTLKKLFEDRMLKYTIVCFAGADEVGNTPDERRKAVENDIKENKQLQELLADAEGRFACINNLSTGQEREQQTRDLLDMMWDLVSKNNGQHYTNRACEEINRQLEALVQARIKRDRISHEEAERNEKEEIVKDKADAKFLDKVKTIVKENMVLLLAPAIGAACKMVAKKVCTVM